MGKVIALPLSRKIATVQPEGATAEILFFTGVRYYRMSEEEIARLATPPQRRTKTKAVASKTAKTASIKTPSIKTAPIKTTAIKAAAPARKLRKLA
jgi:hypothetical protein